MPDGTASEESSSQPPPVDQWGGKIKGSSDSNFKGLKNGEGVWKKELVYDPYSGEQGRYYDGIHPGNFMDRIRELCDAGLLDLSSGQVTEVEWCECDIKGKLAKHEFLAFLTADGYWWAVEKDQTAIYLQRSVVKGNVTLFEPVNNIRRANVRVLTRHQEELIDEEWDISRVLTWMSKRLQTRYHPLFANCQEFVDDLKAEMLGKWYKYGHRMMKLSLRLSSWYFGGPALYLS